MPLDVDFVEACFAVKFALEARTSSSSSLQSNLLKASTAMAFGRVTDS